MDLKLTDQSFYSGPSDNGASRETERKDPYYVSGVGVVTPVELGPEVDHACSS